MCTQALPLLSFSCPLNDYAAIKKYLPERSLNEVITLNMIIVSDI